MGMKCKECDYTGQGTKVCPICYQRLIQERDLLKKQLIVEKEKNKDLINSINGIDSSLIEFLFNSSVDFNIRTNLCKKIYNEFKPHWRKS